jgi:hypothetical protein
MPNVLFRFGGVIRHPLLRGSHLDAVGGPGRRAHPGSAWLAAVLSSRRSSAAHRRRGTGGGPGGRAGSPSPAPRAGAGTNLDGGRGERAGASIRRPAGRRLRREAGRWKAPANRPLTGPIKRPPDVCASRPGRSAAERLTIALPPTVEPYRCRERRDHDLEGEGGGKERSGDGQGRRTPPAGLLEASAWSTAQAPGASAARAPGGLRQRRLPGVQIGPGVLSTAAS